MDIFLMPKGDGSNCLVDFKEELLNSHKEDLIIALDEAINKLKQYGFDINKQWKRQSLKKLNSELYELRQKNIRVLLYFDGKSFFILLHCFLKTTQQTPIKQIKKAEKEIKRWKEMKLNS